ncbi:hypothetical protein AURDEDRAFT_116942 [Auricularia subglabra TFB-10046 SS5]|uniref:Uncharacterized protein n=1 Tax=Auricularia subglabra (strain TFB-10046 / SS5) TaxID=717982 RepID=J0WVJ9_AURST|nr:hypothetical protein AURDEDRAFT_116942 [Auricularia subglabra TFB-10046 SS5]
MASPIIVKAKVSGSAKPKPAGSVVNGSGGGASSASGATTPRLVVRAPHVDTGLRSPRMGASAPSTPVVRVTAKLSSGSKPGSAVGVGVRQRTASTSRPAADRPTHAANRARTGSVYSLNAVMAHRPQSPVRSVVSAVAHARPVQHYQSLSPHTAHSPPASVLSIHSASTGTGSLASTSTSTSSPVSPRPQVIARARITDRATSRERSRSRSASPLSDISSSSSSSSSSNTSSLDPAMEAKVNRKIADLEITNASLLTINASLEALKSKQQKEIWELRRKLRETRLALPPPVFASLKDKDKDKDREEEPEEVEEDVEPEPDPAFDRLSAMLSNMLDEAREALAAPAKTVRVLSEQEVKVWEGRKSGGGGGEDGDEEEEREVTVILDGPPDADDDAEGQSRRPPPHG